jgi:hypothetical protein
MPYPLPFGFDRGDGITKLPAFPYGSGITGTFGTPTPGGAIRISSSQGTIIVPEEDIDSPTIERGEQCTCLHKFTMDWGYAMNLIGALGMGVIVEDSYGYIWRVLTASIQSQICNKAILLVTSESVNFDSPPDDFQVNTVDLGIDIIKHPRYFPNLYPTTQEFGTEVGQIKEGIIRAIQTYRDSPFFPTIQNVTGLINNMAGTMVGPAQENIVALMRNGSFGYLSPNPNHDPSIPTVTDFTDKGVPNTGNTLHIVKAYPLSFGQNASVNLALAAAMEIITKLWRMEDSPYVPGLEVKWSSYFFVPPYLNMGSYIEDPTRVIPDYFLEPDRPLTELPPRRGISYGTAHGYNIFQGNDDINPQDYSATGFPGGGVSISWLRKADEIEYQRTWFKLTRTWIGSAIGYFDYQIYGRWNRPTSTGDYVTFS